MQAIRRTNPGAYRQPRFHYVDGDGTTALCGTDVTQVKGDRRGSWQAPRIERKDADGLGKYDAVCARCRAKLAPPASAAKLSIPEMKALLARAGDAGEQAFRDVAPRPMVVYTPKDVLGSLTGGPDGGPDPDQPVYYESEGICGSGGVIVRPGGSRFARWLLKEGYGSRDSYRGGVYLGAWRICGERGSQSYARWVAAADAITKVFRDAGIEARPQTWVD